MTNSLKDQVFSLLHKYKISPKKRLGQNFLIDETALQSIKGEAALSKNDLVLEIGAGLGQITSALAESVRWVVALEFDSSLLAILKKEASWQGNITFIQTDAACCNYRSVLAHFPEPKAKIKVIGNLPYNVAVPILLRLEEIHEQVSLVVLTLQRELAERFRAVPGTKAYGDLSVRIQYYYQVNKVVSLAPEAFYPRPEVKSEILCLRPLDKPPVDVPEVNFFFQLVRSSFSQRRKTILNALKAHPELGIAQEQWPDLLKEAGIDAQARGESLSLREFARLCRLVLRV